MKTDNNIYHVFPTTPGRWKVIGEGSGPSYHTTEAEAVATARERAMINEPSHVVIHKADGSIEEEHLLQMDSFPHAPASPADTNEMQSTRMPELPSHLRDRSRRNGRSGRQDGYSQQNGASA